jgi:NAD(P)-dependent dehydrogenase (short-subunit alcohol dehydrogenase family)
MFEGKVAVITGGGSGIGAAIADELRRRNATVVTADLVDGDVELDVRDRRAFVALIDEVSAKHGRIDLLFNNAGISIGGESHLMDATYFDRAIDVNLRGVVNGIAATYPRMVAQGHGHIVNTASMAGLVPTPMTAAYAMTKHGIVGLSTSLRPEARHHGVNVSVLCPGAVDTPILDSSAPSDLPPPPTNTLTGREFMSIIKQTPIAPSRIAGPVLRGVARNRAVIIVPASAKGLWYLQRWSPGAVQAIDGYVTRRVLRRIRAGT